VRSIAQRVAVATILAIATTAAVVPAAAVPAVAAVSTTASSFTAVPPGYRPLTIKTLPPIPGVRVELDGTELVIESRHASLEVIDKNVMLTDLNSTNGTFLNGQRLQANQRQIARDSDEIQLGQLLLYIFFEKQPPDIEDASYQAIKKYAHDIK